MGKTLKIKIGGIIETSFIDVINEPSLVIFFSCCNFRCPWCQNYPLAIGKIIKEIELEELTKIIESNKIAIEYVQASGGEPTLQKEGLIELFRKVKEIGLKTSLDTNGSFPEVVEELINQKLLDHFAMDVKFPPFTGKSIEKIIGVSIPNVKEKILKTLNLAKKIKFVELRTTYIPTLVEEEKIYKIAEEISSISKEFLYVVQQFNPNGEFPLTELKKYGYTPVKKLERIAKKIREDTGLRVFIRAREIGVKEI